MSILKRMEKEISKKYAKENPMIVRDCSSILKVPAFSSGSKVIDAVSGIGGLVPMGHVVEIVGANTSGKTTVCLQTCAEATKLGYNVVYIDAESVLDLKYAKALGVPIDSDQFSLIQPQCGEEIIDYLDMLAEALKKTHEKGTPDKKDSVGLIVIDSVAAARPLEELQGNRRIGQHATLWSKISYKIKNMAMLYQIGFALVNQVRYAPDISGGRGASGVLDGMQDSSMSGENTTGGEALKFLYSIRWQFKGFSKVDGMLTNPFTGELEEGRIGNRSRVKTIKNKLAPPLVQSEFVIEYGKGTVDHHTLTEIMKKKGFIENRGSWKRYIPLDDSLRPNMDHADYPGWLYTNKRFEEWYLTPEVQADVGKRFELIMSGEFDGKDVSSDSDNGDEHLEFEIEDALDEPEVATDDEVVI